MKPYFDSQFPIPVLYDLEEMLRHVGVSRGNLSARWRPFSRSRQSFQVPRALIPSDRQTHRPKPERKSAATYSYLLLVTAPLHRGAD